MQTETMLSGAAIVALREALQRGGRFTVVFRNANIWHFGWDDDTDHDHRDVIEELSRHRLIASVNEQRRRDRPGSSRDFERPYELTVEGRAIAERLEATLRRVW